MPATRVDPQKALERVRAAVGESVSELRLNFDQVDLVAPVSIYHDVMTALRDTDDLKCSFFTFLSGIDRSEFSDEQGGLEVLVHVYSPEHVVHVNVHVPVDFEEPRCRSITDLYGGAIWHERECHEMFGIVFEGHPRLVNLYLPEDFEGHPLRRAFKLPSRRVKEWPGAKDPEETAAGGR